MPDVFLTEILGQPDAIQRAATALAGQQDRLERLRGLAPGRLVLTGMGASHDACLAAASVLGSAAAAVTAVNTAELVHFRLPSLTADTVVVAVSQSGRSAELVRLAEAGTPATLVSVTNGLDNPLAAAADLALDTAAGVELGPSTMTFAATFPTLAAVVTALTGTAGMDVPAAAAAAADSARRLLADPVPLADQLVDWVGRRRHAVLVGRGTAVAAAELGALVLKEAAGFAAECLDAAEFRHGPLELAGPDLAVAVVATEESTYRYDRALAAEVAAAGGAVLFISHRPDPLPGALTVAVDPVDRLLAPAVAAIPFQLAAWGLAQASGRDPSRFTVGSKVTTRE